MKVEENFQSEIMVKCTSMLEIAFTSLKILLGKDIHRGLLCWCRISVVDQDRCKLTGVTVFPRPPIKTGGSDGR